MVRWRIGLEPAGLLRRPQRRLITHPVFDRGACHEILSRMRWMANGASTVNTSQISVRRWYATNAPHATRTAESASHCRMGLIAGGEGPVARAAASIFVLIHSTAASAGECVRPGSGSAHGPPAGPAPLAPAPAPAAAPGVVEGVRPPPHWPSPSGAALCAAAGRPPSTPHHPQP